MNINNNFNNNINVSSSFGRNGSQSSLSIDLNRFKINPNSFNNSKQKQQVIIKNDKEKKIEYMLCEIKKINENGYDMDYQCKMNEIFLIGNPIINTNNNKLIGIQKSLNKGILLSNPIN